MRTERIPWQKAEVAGGSREPRRAAGPEWSGRLTGLALLVIALVVIYHGVDGQRMLGQFTSYLSGQPSTPVAATTLDVPRGSAGPASAMMTGLKRTTRLIQAGAWSEADQEVAQLETAWAALSNRYAQAGVSAVDLNAVTADLANLATDLSTRDAAAAQSDVANCRESMTWATTQYLDASAPTLVEFRSLVQDINRAVAARDWGRATADGQALAKILDDAERGF